MKSDDSESKLKHGLSSMSKDSDPQCRQGLDLHKQIQALNIHED